MPENEHARRLAEEILESAKLPTLPEAATHLLALCRDPYVGATEIIRVIELDPALSARLLKVANSAYFGQERKVHTLAHAAVVVGNDYLKAAALGFYVAADWDRIACSGFDAREFWRDAILRACLARQLATASRLQSRELAFLLGLLSDVGTLLLAFHFGDEYFGILKEFGPDFLGRRTIESRRFGVDNSLVTATLANQWNFPPPLVFALERRCQEPPMSATKDTAELLWQITYFCSAVPFSADRQTARIKDALRSLAISAFGLSFEGLGQLFTETVEQYNVMRNVFSSLQPKECQAKTLMDQAEAIMEDVLPHLADRSALQ